MRKNFRAFWPIHIGLACAVLVAAAIVLLGLAGTAAFAAETVVTATEPWGGFFASIIPALTALVTAVLSALGLIVMFYANKFLPAWGTSLVTQNYQKAAEAAAGWLNNYLSGLAGQNVAAPKTLTINSDAVSKAVDYMVSSYPKAADVASSRDEIAHDILAMFGKLFPRLGSMIALGEAIVDTVKK